MSPPGEVVPPRFEGQSPHDAVWGLAWSHDARFLAAASDDNKIRVWDAMQGGQPILILSQHQSDAKGVAWHPSGRQLASASLDGTVRIWAFPSGKLLGTLTGHPPGARGLSWSPDGKFLATAAEDGKTRIFTMDHKSLIQAAQQQAEGGLTPQEREDCRSRIVLQ